LDEVVATHATSHGWPTELARKYLGQLLQYNVSQRHLTAMERFAELAAGLGLIDRKVPLRVLS
jgi:predicted solute-binding protein